ncbi:ribosomal RNA small subunit methyltransferase H isoform X1 [Phoenix dactylifera]|uniref:Ribosomal RNA small subunit methyltransferase H isoform X1 n=1 Tax=Phoenix dactylifera TaxID=42345 RepID=A0A8B7CLD7_PHODC|nr:ribosomal RNA small subunit methyltransferase H isoform X1 [Phoenix dactylifera]
MATWRVFLLHPPHPHARLHSLVRWERRWRLRQGGRELAAVAAACGARARVEKKRVAAKSTASAFADHLTRRTRSGAGFDWDLYRRYADAAGGHAHLPVMLGEVLDVFRHLHLRSFVDCTLGAAGHSVAIIEAHRELELYVGLDVDPVAHDKARARIEDLLNDNPRDGSLKAYTHVRNFKYIKSVLGGIDENLLEGGVDGILMDLGMSSMQVNNSDRGFSVLGDGPLDMRMNPQASLKAEDILNYWPDSEVGRVLRDYGEESNWRFLQKQIVGARADGGLHSTAQLVDLVRSTSAGSGGRHGWIKTATRVFQALRIAVNDELQTLEDAIHACFDCLSSGGRLVVISFHSLEDRIVKRTFLDIIERGEGDLNGKGQREDEADGGGETWSRHRVQGSHGTVLTKRPITPSKEEEKLNRRCRSAKLRVIRKL